LRRNADGQLIVYVAAAGLAGIIAAIRPARRAARLDLLRRTRPSRS
jgi:hypothetical protein